MRATQAKASRRRAEPRLGTRERILAAALEVFAERGFEGATTRDIAARAGSNLGLIQYHFSGKERLWREAIGQMFGELDAALSQVVPAELERPEQLAGIIRVSVHFVARNPHFVRFMNDECKRDSPRMRWLVDHHGRRLYDKAVAILEHAMRRGLIPELPALNAYYLFIGAVGMIFSQAPECRRLTGTDPTTSPAAVEAHADALVALFLQKDRRSRAVSARS